MTMATRRDDDAGAGLQSAVIYFTAYTADRVSGTATAFGTLAVNRSFRSAGNDNFYVDEQLVLSTRVTLHTKRHYPASWQKNEEKNITVSDHIDSNGLRGPTTLEND
ncbi:hypothetical protein QTP88_012085 [Uroleucon formosanum]